MSKKSSLPKRNALGSFEISLDDDLNCDSLEDFAKSLQSLDQEARNLSKGPRTPNLPNPSKQEDDDDPGYRLNTRSLLSDHLAPHQDAPAPKARPIPQKSEQGAGDWMQALVTKPKSPQPDPHPTPVAVKDPVGQTPIKRLPPKPTDKPITVEQMLEDLQSIMMAVNCGSNELQKFSAAHPYLIAPNIYGVWSDTLKETSISLLREYQRLRNRHNG